MYGGPARRTHISFRFRVATGKARPEIRSGSGACVRAARKPISRRVYLYRRLCSIPQSAEPARP